MWLFLNNTFRLNSAARGNQSFPFWSAECMGRDEKKYPKEKENDEKRTKLKQQL
jgi:hypothetical protein